MSKQRQSKFPKYDTLLSVKLSSTTETEVLKILESCLRKDVQLFISTPNPEIVLQAQSDKKLLSSLNKADIAIPDGIGLLWAAKRLNFPYKLNRIAGRKLVESIFLLSNRKKYKVFLLGASEKVNNKALKKLNKKFPKIKAKGTSDINVDIEGKSDDNEVVKQINDFKPHILLVALGAPKQEKWVAANLRKLNVGAVMVVGGSLDYFAGTVPMVPTFISSKGLEWLWRLITQPSRFPRIFNAVVRFPLFVITHRNDR